MTPCSDLLRVCAVRSGDQVKHYKVLQTDQNRFYVEPGRRFSSLAELVDYYQKTSLNNAGPLGNPCKRVSQAASVPSPEVLLKVHLSPPLPPSEHTQHAGAAAFSHHRVGAAEEGV